MTKTEKTNASRLLTQAGVAYTLVPYPVDEEHLEAGHIADTLGEDIRRVYKTIVLKGERTGHFVCVVRGDSEIDLKKAARAAGDKACELIPVRQLLPLTGYVRGGCSPVGMRQPLRTFYDRRILDCDTVYVSAGRRGLQLCLAPQDLVDYTRGTIADLV